METNILKWKNAAVGNLDDNISDFETMLWGIPNPHLEDAASL